MISAMRQESAITMNLEQYRQSGSEQLRTRAVLAEVPTQGLHALDIGARDGHFSRLLAERFARVTALDLSQPSIDHPTITCVAGNAAALQFDASCFDFVLCAEVLEHIPEPTLSLACKEIARVAADRILIGVPYRQDIRLGRTTCSHCGGRNPPWGHVNSFDEARLQSLFPSCAVESVSFVGETTAVTTGLATRLLDYAGNPFGTYDQEEPCVHCDKPLGSPQMRTLAQRIATRFGTWMQQLAQRAEPPRGNWIHMQFRKLP